VVLVGDGGGVRVGVGLPPALGMEDDMKDREQMIGAV